MKPVYVTRAGILGTLIALVVAGVCVRLGIWQLDRLDQRRKHNAAVAGRMAEPPVDFNEIHGDTTGLLYRNAVVRGHYDQDRTVLLAGRDYRGRGGVHVLTPLQLESGGTILVNRGWLPAIDPREVPVESYRKSGLVRVRGLIMSLPHPTGSGLDEPADAATVAKTEFRRVWYRFSGGDITAWLPYPVRDVYLQILPGRDAPDAPVPLPRPMLGTGRHLGYAIQWFSFAAVALIGWGVLALRKGEVGRRGGKP